MVESIKRGVVLFGSCWTEDRLARPGWSRCHGHRVRASRTMTGVPGSLPHRPGANRYTTPPMIFNADWHHTCQHSWTHHRSRHDIGVLHCQKRHTSGSPSHEAVDPVPPLLLCRRPAGAALSVCLSFGLPACRPVPPAALSCLLTPCSLTLSMTWFGRSGSPHAHDPALSLSVRWRLHPLSLSLPPPPPSPSLSFSLFQPLRMVRLYLHFCTNVGIWALSRSLAVSCMTLRFEHNGITCSVHIPSYNQTMPISCSCPICRHVNVFAIWSHPLFDIK